MGLDFDAYGNPFAVPDAPPPEPSPETIAYFEGETAKLEASTQPQGMSQSQIDNEIASIRASAAFNSKDSFVREPAVQRLILLTSGQPVTAQPAVSKVRESDAFRDPRHPDHEAAVDALESEINGEVVPPEVYDRMDPEQAALTAAEGELRKLWGREFESRSEALLTWTESLDARLGSSGREFSDLLESSGLANSVPLAKVMSEALRGADHVDLSPSEAATLKDKLHQLALRRDLNPALWDAVVEGLHELSRIVYGGTDA
jgi:hypothetical protein